MAKNVVVSLSGGMDSSTLLLRCLSDYDNVTALSFDYGQKHRVELERAQSLVDYLNENGQNVTYQEIKLDGLVNLLDSNLVEGGEDVPEGHYEEENMVATVVPNRNKIFSSLTQAVALSISKKTGESCDIALIIPTKLSLPGVKSPNPAINPCVLSNDAEAVVDKFTSVSSAEEPIIVKRSGPEPTKRVTPIITMSL